MGSDGALQILFLNSWKAESWEGSGTAVGIAGLRKGLEALGHRVEVVRPSGTGSPGLLRRLRFNLELPRLLRSYPPADLVVGFDLDGVRWGRRRRPPGSPYVVCLKGVAADESRFAGSRTESLYLRSLAALEARNARNADGVIVPSRYSARAVEEAYGIPGDRIRVVPEAVDTAPFEALRRDPPALPEAPTILSVAHQYPRKDTATLLRALPVVHEQFPSARLRIVGGGPELPRLRDLARRLLIHDAVEFTGPVADDREVRTAYFRAHLFCLPSLQEGFGIVFVEAMAAGLPVVAARAGAAPEVVEHGVTGVLVPPRSPEMLASALIRLLRREDDRRAMSERGPERAAAYRPEQVAREFLGAVGALTGRTSTGEEFSGTGA